jgi:putative transposase
MPIAHRRAIRTTYLLERLLVEERRRLKIIPDAFGERAVLKLMFGAMIRAAERWRAMRITDFERRQMAVLRQELDHEYQARNGLASTPSAETHSDLTVNLKCPSCSTDGKCDRWRIFAPLLRPKRP